MAAANIDFPPAGSDRHPAGRQIFAGRATFYSKSNKADRWALTIQIAGSSGFHYDAATIDAAGGIVSYECSA